MVKIDQRTVLVENLDFNSFSNVVNSFKEELNEHREVINENSAEISDVYGFLSDLDRKIDFLSSKIEELTLIVKGKPSEKTFNFKPLSGREKEIFYALYVLGEGRPCVSYSDLARRTCSTKGIVSSFISSMIEKGIPIIKKYDGNRVYIQIKEEFRLQQAKKNILGLDSKITSWISKD